MRLTVVRLSMVLLLVATLGMGSYASYRHVTGNLHPVVPGEFYRSAQLSPSQLAAYARQFGIRTIVNLRGAHPGQAWYDQEVATAAELGVAHIDFKMSANRELPRARAERLLQILDGAQKPILVHCQGGADRSGLAGALYLAALAKQGEGAAERQLSIWYGHIGVPYLSSTAAMDRTFEALESWLGFSGS